METKTPRSRRTLVLPDLANDALREHRHRQLQERLSAGSRWVESGFVFTTTIGSRRDRAFTVGQLEPAPAWTEVRRRVAGVSASDTSVPNFDSAAASTPAAIGF